MRFLFIGDIVGAPGVAAARKIVPQLRRTEGLDFVVANAENATNGSGCSPRDYRALRAAGIDAVTLGDHVYSHFVDAKRAEWDEYKTQVSDWEIERYLEQF